MRCESKVLLFSLLRLTSSAAGHRLDSRRRRRGRDPSSDGGGLGAGEGGAGPDCNRRGVVSVGREEGVELLGAGPAARKRGRVRREKVSEEVRKKLR